MRKLFFVPIIHSPADMGTMGAVLSETSAAALGPEVWDSHQKTISGFWEAISQFFNSLPAFHYKIFQDGLIAGGENGLRIVNEGVRLGSVNYMVISNLLARGAGLIKTEDIVLIQQEYDYLKKLTNAKSKSELKTAAQRYRLAQTKLIQKRDAFIARTIDSNLIDNDTGVLFIGAYHDVLAKLPVDIQITEVKELAKIREYHQLLRNMTSKTGHQYQELALYLSSPVAV
jgi:hypothetical protein